MSSPSLLARHPNFCTWLGLGFWDRLQVERPDTSRAGIAVDIDTEFPSESVGAEGSMRSIGGAQAVDGDVKTHQEHGRETAGGTELARGSCTGPNWLRGRRKFHSTEPLFGRNRSGVGLNGCN